LKKPAVIVLAGFLSSCGIVADEPSSILSDPRTQSSPLQQQLHTVPDLDGTAMTIGVYNFDDKTGQRKPNARIASLSSAVTQGAESWVISALLEAGNGTWFEVVERGGLDNIIKERQLIRNTRENYLEDSANLQPMKFAGLILEGGIVGYDSNVATGGTGARYLGIGATTEYRIDTVTVVMRLVSVNTGRVLLSVATEKSIASYRSGADIFRFLDLGTQALETETGFSVNEPVNYAVRSAIDAGVIQMIHTGEQQGFWEFKHKE